MNNSKISPEVLNLYSQFLTRNVEVCEADKSILSEILQIVESSSIEDLQTSEDKRATLNSLYKTLTKSSKKGIQETDPRKVVFKDMDLKGKNFLDYGSNKFDTVMKLHNWDYGAKFYACDVVDKEVDELWAGKIDYKKIQSDSILPYESEFFDVINIQYVLHHIASDESIINLLKEFKRILKNGGQMILWEETFYNKSINHLPNLAAFNKEIGIATDVNLTTNFYELTDEQKFEFILLNDVMINLNNPHMQWDVNYKTHEQWKELFQSQGFKFKYIYNWGLRSSGSLKQGANIVSYFTKAN